MPSALAEAKQLYASGQLRESIPFFQRACDEEWNNPETWYRCGLALMGMRDYRGAVPFLEYAVKCDPHSAAAAYNLGCAYETQGRDQSAERMHRKALEMVPSAIPWVNLGGILYRRGDREAAYAAHSNALAVQTTDPDQLGQRAFVRMVRGDYPVGFKEYEHRWQSMIVKATNYRPHGTLRWSGKDLNGKTLLVHAEQGIGDTVQMLRYLPSLLERNVMPLFMVPEALVRIVQQTVAPFPVLPMGADYLTSVRRHVPMMSLPGVLGTTIDTVPWSGPYLQAPGTLDTSMISRETRPLVGYAEYGNKDHMNDRDRSVPLKLRGLFPTDTAFDWIALDRTDCPFEIRDIGDTMDVIDRCDAVLTVDTAIAHLAGAMGKPTVMIPPASPEWRWGLEGESSPWYPTMTLVRRETTHDWPNAVQRAHQRLRALLSISS